MTDLATLGTLLLSLTHSGLALALLLIYLPPRGRQMLRVTTGYWPAALIVSAVSSSLFAWGALRGGGLVLTLANVSSVACAMLTAMAAARWTRALPSRLLPAMIIFLVVGGALFDLLRREGALTFALRVHIISGLMAASMLWLVVELWRIDRLHRSVQLRLAMACALVVVLACLGRSFGTVWLDVSATANLYNEPDLLFYLRVTNRAALILLALTFHNACVDRLLQQEIEARRLHQRLFDTMPSAGLIWDDRGRVVRLNAEAERLFGWTTEEIEGQDVVELLFVQPTADRARELLRPWSVASRVFDRRDVLETRTRHGRVLECEWVCRYSHQHDQGPPEVMAVVSDVSEQRARERRAQQDRDDALDRESVLASRLVRVQGDLADLRSDLAEAADAARLGMWVEHLDSSFTMSLRCGAIFGLPANGVKSFNELIDRFHPEDRPRAQGLYRELSEQGRCVWEARLIRGDDDSEVVWVSIWAQGERSESGALRRVRAIVLDISDRRHAEIELLQRRREVAHLARVNTLGELTGGLAHELNQPLTAILGNAEAGLRLVDIDGPHGAELRDILQDIVKEDQRASEVIRRLRRLVTKGEVRSDFINLEPLVASTLALIRSELAAQRVTVSCGPLDNLAVHGDEVQLQQVLLNLILNALEAMRDKPTSARHVWIEAHLKVATSIELSVSDSGSGLNGADPQRIFEPFVTSKPGGMGLGLSICRTIIRGHGGEIRATNRPQGGAVFTVTLPRATIAVTSNVPEDGGFPRQTAAL